MILEADKNRVIPQLPGRMGIVLRFCNIGSPTDRAPENPIDRRYDPLSNNTSILGEEGSNLSAERLGHFKGLACRDPDARMDFNLEAQPIRLFS